MERISMDCAIFY